MIPLDDTPEIPGLHPLFVQQETRKNYCWRLQRRGLCGRAGGGTCTACHPYLETASIFRGAVQNLAGLFQFKLREQAARAIEDLQPPMPDHIHTSGDNPFHSILKEIS
nr:hypothetical protein [Anaerolineae bacterium]